MPSVGEVIESVKTEDSSSLLKCPFLGNCIVQRHIDEMALDLEKTLI